MSIKQLNILLNWRSFKLRLFLRGILVGLFAGSIVVFFRYCLEKADYFLQMLYSFLHNNNPWFIVIWSLVLLSIAAILGYIAKKEPMAGGSGIPQIKGVIAGQMNMNWYSIILSKFVGGLLAIGAGLSLGREGPSIQLGAAAGQGINRLFRGVKVEEKILVTSGAAAGLAAAFNAPLAGVIFSLEEVHKNFSPPILMSAMAASLTADLVSTQFFGIKPIFNFESLPLLPLYDYYWLVILGVVVGIFGVAFNRALIKTLDFYRHQTIIPKHFASAIPLALALVLGMFLPSALGSGHGLIEAIRQQHFTLGLLVLLVTVKFLFTMFSYGSGVPGGIFLPLLVIGALTGGIFANVVINLFHLNPQYINNFVVFAMAGYFTAIVKAPITGSILITEMTGSFHHLLALIIVCMTAYVISDLLDSKPVYDQLLTRLLKNRRAHLPFRDSQKKILLEVVVCMGSGLDCTRVREVNWPENCLLVSVRRGESEFIPHGDSLLAAGDFINILTSKVNSDKTFTRLQSLAQQHRINKPIAMENRVSKSQ